MSEDINDDIYSKDDWIECWNCGGKGGRDYEEDLQFEDPLWYIPDDFVKCDICNGKGGFYVKDEHIERLSRNWNSGSGFI